MNFYLDIRTLYFCYATICGLAFLLLWTMFETKRRYHGVSIWLIGILFLTLGSLLAGLKDFIPGYISFVGGNGFILVSFALTTHGIGKLKESKLPSWPAYLILITGIVCFLFATNANLRIKLICFSSFGMIASFWQAYVCLNPSGKNYNITRTIGAGMSILCLTFILRIFNYYKLTEIKNDYMQMGYSQGLYLLVTMAVIFLLIVTFILLVNKRLENELIDANAMKNTLFSVIGHDLRGSIGGLKTSLEILSEELKSDILPSMADEANRSFLLLESLLAWAKNQKHQLHLHYSENKLEDLVLESVRQHEKQALHKHLSIKKELTDESVVCDRQTVTTILRNLISNAIKFSPEGKEIKIKTYRENNFGVVSITNCGTGLSETIMQNIISGKSVTSQVGTYGELGTGFGLSMCREFANLNKGSLRIEVNASTGNTISILLPKKEEGRFVKLST
ncbi:sensor histidine kinase [Leptospira sp. 'Mane']|uniref:sensor histidine kinase n=1 Tax=Leptospira sp. 'Mane' TaxID=3387407 RepID=UPI00398AF4AD